ncbi:MAG: hypothetical protein JWM85_421, partial [Acidimicrobiaceae bacterium]|nr:hypothetical protein [Acidimicrobiaceae bacterium]
AGAPSLGFAAPLLYQVAGNPVTYASSFNDIKKGNNDVFGLGRGYSAHAGYDLASGLGSPIVTDAAGSGGLDASLCAAAKGAPVISPTVSAVSPSTGPATGGQRVTITGTGFPAGEPGSVRVDFGTSTASVVAVPSSTTLVVTTPAGATPAGVAPGGAAGVGAVQVVVTVRGAGRRALTSRLGTSSIYEYLDQSVTGSETPVVSGVGLPGGNVAGGNVVTIYGGGFQASGAGQLNVSFGAVPASSVQVVSDSQLRATVPPERATTACSTGRGFSPATDCQVEVEVSDALGTSPVATILPAISGPIVFDAKGVVEPTPETEVAPASTEYDYSPTPVIRSISPNPGDANGTIPVVIHGSGFDFNTLEWINFGPPSSVASEQTQITSITPTEITIAPPPGSGSGSGAETLRGGVSVESLGGLSNAAPFSYGGTPVVRRISSFGGPAIGGTSLHLTGVGLASVKVVEFVSQVDPQQFGSAMSTAITSSSANSLVVRTPADLPGPVDVLACSASGCSRPDPTHDTFVYYSTAIPTLKAAKPLSGLAKGGTRVTLFGNALDGLVSVRFGAESSSRVQSPPGYPDGDPYVAEVLSPPGPAGTSVPITVVTRAGRTQPRVAATFHYLASGPSAPRAVAVSVGGSTAHLSWVAPTSDGGAPVTGYIAVAVADATAPVVEQLGAAARSATFGPLAAGRSYAFRVVAENARYGRGPWATVAAREVVYTSDGYRIAYASGRVDGFGSLPALGGLGAAAPVSPVVGIADSSDGAGYWLLQANGTVRAFGDALQASYAQTSPSVPMTGITASPSDRGYLLVNSAGDVSSFGAARNFGSLPSSRLVPGARVVGIASDSDGSGYWLASSTGGVYAFGDAPFLGAAAGRLGGDRVVALAAAPSGQGYWLATASGRILAFGSAGSYGEPRAASLKGTIVGIAPSADGRGYWLATSTGAIYAYGDARYEGRASPSPGVASLAAG